MSTSYFKALKRKEIEELLDRPKLGYLGTIGNDQPYITPIAFAYEDGTLYFNTLEGTKKVENIRKNPEVCFVVVESTPDLSGTKQVAVFGEAERLEELNDDPVE
jgi:nitroimidazol reductase NimA-like FMN-containing flavoprotein (pyridoxamine 5'-phosphate oxidase superfamily)